MDSPSTPKSEFVVEVVRVTELVRHPNADTLSIAKFETADGPSTYEVIVRTQDWAELPRLAVYVPVDSVVDRTQPEFEFLKADRIKAARLRGIYSEGLLVPPRPGLEFGQSVAFLYNVKKHLTPEEKAEAKRIRFMDARPLPRVMPDYGLDSFKRFGRVLREGEEVYVTEKIHGTNARFVYTRGALWVGSHHRILGYTFSPLRQWLDRLRLRLLRILGRPARTSIYENLGDVWWRTAKELDLENRLKTRPNVVCYGEIYGPGIQTLPYDAITPTFRVFDFYDLRAHKFYGHEQLRRTLIETGLRGVPLLYVGPFGEQVLGMAEGPSTLNPTHVREGVVIKPTVERYDPKCGRVALKLVGQGYRLREA